MLFIWFSLRVVQFGKILTCISYQKVKDQQEAERKKVASQEIQQALDEQTKVIGAKQQSVREDLAGVEPAVTEAQQGRKNI